MSVSVLDPALIFAERLEPQDKRPKDFFTAHPFRVDLPDGYHVRFTTLASAASSAFHHRVFAVTDESTGKRYEQSELRAYLQ